MTRPDERNGRKNLSSGRLLLDWKPSDDWSIGLNINGGLDRSDTQAAQFRGPTISEPGFSLLKNNRPELFNFPIAPNKARAADFDPKLDLSQRNSLWQTALTVQHQLTGYVALKSITSFVQFKQFQPLDTDGTPYDAFGGPVSGNLKSLYQELRVQREGEGLNWIVGANYIRDKIVERQRSTSTQSGFSIVGVSAFDNNNRQKADTKSIYGNITYSFAEGLKLESGLRYTKQKRNFTACSRADDIVTATIYSNRLPIAIGDCLTLGPTGAWSPARQTGRRQPIMAGDVELAGFSRLSRLRYCQSWLQGRILPDFGSDILSAIPPC
ncbi:TonB-dependent receptor [Sphingobium sp. LB126]|uniref:TonB-dependent receptor n=1 Tax=Sphingobium sp. LB126 TaxID=1983755 RepID=UPI0012FD5736|nr:TonB-dependent receptor [Sphingobium sp. LB126]